MKALRIYLKQPSPQWLDYTLRMVTLYSKRTDYSQNPGTMSPTKGVTGNAFDTFKTKLNQNLKGLKKSTKNADENNE